MNRITELARYLIVNYVVEYNLKNDFDEYKDELLNCQFNTNVMFSSPDMICKLFPTSKEIQEILNYYNSEWENYSFENKIVDLDTIADRVLYIKGKGILDELTFEDFIVFKNIHSKNLTVWIRKYFEFRDTESDTESESEEETEPNQ